MQGPLILLAPSKTMDFTTPISLPVTVQQPIFLEDAAKIVTKLEKLSVARIMTIMSISKPIASSVQEAYRTWCTEQPGRPALWTYVGDVYKGMRAHHLTADDAKWAQEHLVISSGLYGLLRPNDGVQRYRLEMKAAIKLGRKNNLYEFWGTKLSDYVDSRGAEWLCNLSSQEYARPIMKQLNTSVITPVFFDTKPSGVVGAVPIYSKMMRGVMARWMIDQRVTVPEQLKQFTAHGYSYDAARSKPTAPAFSRAKMVPLVFEK